MKKNRATIVSLFALTALGLSLAAAARVSNDNATLAQASQAVSAAATGEELIAPASYEEYLILDEPSCVAVCENYTAIADGNRIYIFDKSVGVYKTYTHGSGATQDDIKKMQFWGGNILFFADNGTGNNFYKLNAATLETATEIPDIACGTFLIVGEDLYFTNSSGSLFATTLQDAENDLPKTALLWNDVSSLAYYNDELYFVHAKFYLHKINPRVIATPDVSKTLLTSFSQVVESMAITEGVLSCTTATGSFYAYALGDIATADPLLFVENDGHQNAYPFGENVYVVQTDKKLVKTYSATEKAFTSYEISSNSASSHRLSGATDIALFGDCLYIADDGNARLSIYDTTTQTLDASFSLSTAVTYLSTDGETLCTASTTQAVLYTATGETLAAFDAFNGAITGVASVYGTHYIVTESNYFYAVSENSENVWERTEVKKTSTHPPQSLTADAQGNLYIKSGAYAYAFSEETFMQADGNGEKRLENLPTDVIELAVDYDGNIYTLGNGVTKYEKQADGTFTQTAIDVSKRFVYGNPPTLTALAFGIERNAAYLLCNGNYLIQTENLRLPTVTDIPVNGADEKIFAQEEAAFEIVKTKPKTLLIAFDVNRLKGATSFPYLHFLRSEKARTALKIGEDSQGKYNLIAHFDETTSSYSTYLVAKDACETLSSEDYRVEYAESERTDAWLTNTVSLYKFPYLCDQLLVANALPRGSKVTLLGEIGELDHKYYRIAYTDENGTVLTGYIPQSYATTFDASPKPSNQTVLGDASDTDGVWRLAYILLGLGAVCILVDFLLLRKKKDD